MTKSNYVAFVCALLLTACARPEGSNGAIAARANASVQTLSADINGLECIVTPLRDGTNPLGAPLRGVYHVSADRKKASFALIMPQGSKIGQCNREEQKTRCTSGRIPYSTDMVEQSFTAINMLMGAEADKTDLEPGESADNFVYRRKSSSWKFELRILEFKYAKQS